MSKELITNGDFAEGSESWSDSDTTSAKLEAAGGMAKELKTILSIMSSDGNSVYASPALQKWKEVQDDK